MRVLTTLFIDYLVYLLACSAIGLPDTSDKVMKMIYEKQYFI